MAKTLTGVVSSDRADKTIVVTVRTRKTHPIYKKQYTISTKFMAHDEANEAKLGDTVVIVETRPISARKRFKLDKIAVKALVRHEETYEIPAEITTKDAPPKPAKEVKSSELVVDSDTKTKNSKLKTPNSKGEAES